MQLQVAAKTGLEGIGNTVGGRCRGGAEITRGAVAPAAMVVTAAPQRGGGGGGETQGVPRTFLGLMGLIQFASLVPNSQEVASLTNGGYQG